jgi:hypothetical protein
MQMSGWVAVCVSAVGDSSTCYRFGFVLTVASQDNNIILDKYLVIFNMRFDALWDCRRL